MENERAETGSGEETGVTGTPAGKNQARKTQLERNQDKQLETGEENPG
jgi:hypothetical protein